jgi:hypothetical protein
MANTVPTITPGSITRIKGQEAHPVYFVNLNHSMTPNLVVKGERAQGLQEGATSIKWGSKIMKNVNNSLVDTKILTPAEINIFKQAVMANFPPHSQQYANVAPGGLTFTWTKMPFVSGLSSADLWDGEGTGKRVDVENIKRSVIKLLDETAWFELGKVVAVDIFNGNSDRFDIGTGGHPGQWVNKGNLLFVASGPTTKVIGLDTFDPNTFVTPEEESNLATGRAFDALRILIDPGRRNTFAKACVISVGDEMKRTLQSEFAGLASFTLIISGPTGREFLTVLVSKMDQLFLPYVPNFEQGLKQGADQLKVYLQSKVRQYATAWKPARPQAVPWPKAPMGWQRARPVPTGPTPAPGKTVPQGILNRMAFLGWSV